MTGVRIRCLLQRHAHVLPEARLLREMCARHGQEPFVKCWRTHGAGLVAAEFVASFQFNSSSEHRRCKPSATCRQIWLPRQFIRRPCAQTEIKEHVSHVRSAAACATHAEARRGARGAEWLHPSNRNPLHLPPAVFHRDVHHHTKFQVVRRRVDFLIIEHNFWQSGDPCELSHVPGRPGAPRHMARWAAKADGRQARQWGRWS